MKLEIENLHYSYGDDKPVLQGVNLTIDKPGLYCIIGPNGVGKSTLVKCIDKIIAPSSGDIRINGIDLKDISIKENSKIMAYVPVSGTDCFSMPVIDTILIGRHAQQKWRTTNRDLEIVYKTMKLLGISHLSMHGYNELSAGQHQKVSIARGLVQSTKFLILDEPTSNLDVRYQIYVTELLRELADRNDMIILMISHDLNISARYASEIIVMSYPGVIYKTGSPEDVLTENLIREVYGVDCDVITDRHNKPHVILGSALRIEE